MQNVYDFDNTIYNGDCTIDFYIYCLKKHPNILIFIPIQIFYFILFKLNKITKTNFKEKFFLFLNVIKDINEDVNDFWIKNERKIKKWYYDIHNDSDIIISASPEFLLIPICERLKVSIIIASKVNKKNGKYNGLNCYGEEKVRRLLELYPTIEVKKFYSDSYSDQPLSDLARESFIVQDGKVCKWNEIKNRQVDSTFKKLINYLLKNKILMYVIFGGFTVLVNLISYLIIRRFFKLNLNISNILSIIIAILFAYYVNAKYVFKSKFISIKQKIIEFVKFLSSRIITMMIEIIGFFILTVVTNLNDFISKLLIQVVIILLNYFFCKLIFFNDSI